MKGKIAVILATCDTKGLEAVFVKEFLEERGLKTIIADVGAKGDLEMTPDVKREEVSALAGYDHGELLGLRRDEIMRAMGIGAGKYLEGLLESGELGGVLAVGGNQGTAIASIAMQGLPVGVPKIVVSTVASGNVRPYVGSKDIVMMFSVADILGGPNRVTRTILANAAGALLGMVQNNIPLEKNNKKAVAVTAFGNTNAVVTRSRAILAERGLEVVAFHASGACGSAMEELIEQGVFDAVLDLTTHEFLGEIFGDDIYAPVKPGRLTAAGRRGIPQVIAPGGMDYFCFGPPESVPQKYQGRPTHYHNPYNTNIRATAQELRLAGEKMAERLNQARGPVVVMLPLRGWSENGREGNVLHDPEGDRTFMEALKKGLKDPVRVEEVDANINDPVFADRAAEVLLGLLGLS